jgi:hypothetical protein
MQYNYETFLPAISFSGSTINITINLINMKRLFFVGFISISSIMTINAQQWQSSGNNIYNTNSGNVGIGTTNPLYIFDVKVATNQHIGIRQANSYASLGTFDDVGTSYVRLDIDALTLNLNAYSGGNVGIGTADPGSYRLNVAGIIQADEVVVNTGGADFVFASDYKLLSLSEVEEYIIENNHLPYLAPASEMKENGMNVSEMQTILLQKIEGLTLYSIQQKKEIELLKQEITILKNK